LNLVGTSKKTPSGSARFPLEKHPDLSGRVVCAQQLLAETQLQRQVYSPRLLAGQEGVGATFNNKPALFMVDDICADPAAQRSADS